MSQLRFTAFDRLSALARHRVTAIAGGFTLWIVNVAWFRVIQFETLMGDDIILQTDFAGHPFWRTCFFSSIRGKYRPVYYVVQYTLFKLFGARYPLFFWFNVAFHAVLATLLYLFLARVTRRNWLLSFLIAMMFVTARYAYYDIAQLLGLMEALALLWMLGLLFSAWQFCSTQRPEWLAGLLVSFVLLVFTHERYITAAPLVLLLLVFAERPGGTGKVLWATALVSPLPLYAVLKLQLDSNLLLGTGSTAIKPVPTEIAGFWIAGIANLFGINNGPSHLSIWSFPDLPLPNQIAAAAFCAAAVVCIVLFVRTAGRRGALIAGGWAVLTGSLVLAASVTIRQEFRWLFAPYMASLLFWGYAIESIRSRTAAALLAAAMFASTILNDRFYREARNNLFFMAGEGLADSLYRGTLLRYGYADHDFYLEPFAASKWLLQPEFFFRQFLGPDAKPIRTSDPAVEASWSGADFSRAKFFARSPDGREIIEVTEVYRERAFGRGKRLVADLVDRFASAQVSGRHLGPQYPAGDSVSIQDLAGGRAICALPSSEISYDVVIPPGRAYLTFVIDFHPSAKKFGISDGCRASVKLVTADGHKSQAWTDYLLPDGEPHFVAVPLDACAGATCRLTLETSNDPGKTGGGDWPVWIEPRIVSTDATSALRAH
jgi:hypothetical protein